MERQLFHALVEMRQNWTDLLESFRRSIGCNHAMETSCTKVAQMQCGGLTLLSQFIVAIRCCGVSERAGES
jgi:hypothetical protein